MMISRRKLITRAAAAGIIAAPYGFIAPVRKLYVPPAQAFIRGALATVGGGGIPSGFPTADNTGVPAGTVLTQMTDRFTTDTDGEVFNNINFQLGAVVQNEGLTFNNCQFNPNGFAAGVNNVGTLTTGPVYNRCTFVGDSIAKCITWGTGKMIACQVIKGPDGVELAAGDTEVICNNVLIEDCLIIFTPADFEDGEHPDCIEGDGNHSNVTIRHNTILNQQNNNSSITCSTHNGAISNLTVDNNYLGTGNFSMYYGQMPLDTFTFTGATITNNRVIKGGFEEGGQWQGGYCSVGTVLGTHIVSGNVDAVTGANIDAQMMNGG